MDVRASVYKPESAGQNAVYISLNRKKKVYSYYLDNLLSQYWNHQNQSTLLTGLI